jgi:hypothetical protein
LLVVGGLAAASLALTAATVLDPNLQRDDVRSLAAASQGEDLVVVFPEFERRPLLRYGRQLEPAPPSGVSARTIIVAVRKSRDSPRPYRPPGSFSLVGEERLQRFVIRRYRSPVAVRFGPRGVSASARGYAVLVRRRST